MSAKQLPIWVREKYLVDEFGLTRTILRGMREDALITSVSLKKDGCKQGALLYKMRSVVNHLLSCNDHHAKRFHEKLNADGFSNVDESIKTKILESESNIIERLGLTRSILRGLRFENPEFVVSFKRPGRKHGTLRYDMRSLIDYIDSLAAEQMKQIRNKFEGGTAKLPPQSFL